MFNFQNILSSFKNFNFNQWIRELSLYKLRILLIASALLGIGLNIFFEVDLFYLKMSLVLFVIYFAFREIQWYLHRIKFHFEETASQDINLVNESHKSLINSYWSIPFIFVISAVFLWATVELRFIEMNLLGMVFLFFATIMLSTAIYAQVLYVYFLIYLDKLFECEKFKYNFYFPVKTEWVETLWRISTRFSNSFFLAGFFYTVIFAIHSPGTIASINLTCDFLDYSCIFDTSNDMLYFSCWLIIGIVIFLAFPLYRYIQKRLLKRIIAKMKNISIDKLSKIYDPDNKDIENDSKLVELINKIEASPNLPFKQNRLIPILTSLASLLVQILKISSSFG